MSDTPLVAALRPALEDSSLPNVLDCESLHWELLDVYAFSKSRVFFTMVLEDEDEEEQVSAWVRADLETSPPSFEAHVCDVYALNLLPLGPDEVYLHGGNMLLHWRAGEWASYDRPEYWAGDGPIATPDGLVIWGTKGIFRFDGTAFEALPFEASAQEKLDIRGVSYSQDTLWACGSRGGLYRWDGQIFRKIDSHTTAFLTAVYAQADGTLLLVGDEGFVADLRDGALTRLEVESDTDKRWRIVPFAGSLYLSDGSSLFRREGRKLVEVRDFEGSAYVYATEHFVTVSSFRDIFLFDGTTWTQLTLGAEGEFVLELRELD